MSGAYEIPAERLELEPPKVKGSRFIAFVSPADIEADAVEHLARVRRKHHAARHVCWAWRLDERARCSDDGEPAGSAGRPILAAIEGAGLRHVSVAVVRYFGGTKLGVGGLVRAYGGAAAEALERVARARVVPTARLRVRCGYPELGVLERFQAQEGLAPVEADYGEAVALTFEVPVAEIEGVSARLVDASAGRIDVER